MSTEVVMPQMGESIAEGTITTWFKKVGDYVEKDEPLFEISTDKVDAEIPSPASGYLASILHQEMETVEVDKVVARITAKLGEEAAAPPSAVKSVIEKITAAETPATPVAEAVSKEPVADVEQLRRTRSSPLVRKIASEHGVDITQLQGTGISGRVTKKDILGYLDNRSTAPAAAPAAKTTTVTPDRYLYKPQGNDRVEPF